MLLSFASAGNQLIHYFAKQLGCSLPWALVQQLGGQRGSLHSHT